MKAKILGWLKTAAQNGEILETEESLTLFQALSRFFNQEAIRRIVREGRISNHVIILVNGVDANLLGGLSTQLKDGDEITVIPVVHGG